MIAWIKSLFQKKPEPLQAFRSFRVCRWSNNTFTAEVYVGSGAWLASDYRTRGFLWDEASRYYVDCFIPSREQAEAHLVNLIVQCGLREEIGRSHVLRELTIPTPKHR